MLPLQDQLTEYRERLVSTVRPLLRARRFIAAASWTKATTEDGVRFVGLFRDQEPDLAAILAHRTIVILGEPGAGKSTTGELVTQHILARQIVTDIPIVTSLKSFAGTLRPLFVLAAPEEVLDRQGLRRTYVLDGVDEVPPEHRDAFRREVQQLLIADGEAKIICTSRQAFHVQHPEAFPDTFAAFHLLEFDDNDIRAYVTDRGQDASRFLAAVRDADCAEEIRNPFVLDVMLKRYRDLGGLSPLRSENVRYVVDQLIQRRPAFSTILQRRALKMLAITCETCARNELTVNEALRVLRESIEISLPAAQELLDDLCHTILLRTPQGVNFPMRSYGEFLAAEALYGESVDRLKELAFVNDVPIDSWANAITYLAEMHPKVRHYFARHHPTWLVNVSTAAFSDAERTALVRRLLQDINDAQTYLVNHRTIPLRHLARLITPDAISELHTQLTSAQPHEVANALALLSMHDPSIVPLALQLATEHRNASTLRYAAIVALINAGDPAVLDRLMAFADPTDTYAIHITDAIGSLCTPADFPRVLPLLQRTNAGLSSAFYHFRELTSKEALAAAIAYLTTNPSVLSGHELDAYLEPIINLIPTYCDDELRIVLGGLLAALERDHYSGHREKLVDHIVTHLGANDEHAVAIQTLITSLAADNTRLRFIDHAIAPLITPPAAQWINDHAALYAEDLLPWLPAGPARDLFAPQSPALALAQEQARAQYLAAEQARELTATSTRMEHQATIRSAFTINAVIGACERLPREHWPDVSPERCAWLTQHITGTLVGFDLARSVTWDSDSSWTHPRGLEPLLNLVDFYTLRLTDDVPIVLALRSWPDKAITNYYRREGFTTAAKATLTTLVATTEHDNIAGHAIGFVRETRDDTLSVRTALTAIALNTARSSRLRNDALEALAQLPTTTPTFVTLATDSDVSLRERAFRHLVKQQHQATIARALNTLSDEQLRAGEVPIPESSPLDWIGTITASFAIDDLKRLRERTLALNAWRPASLITAALAKIDKQRAASIIRQQLAQTPTTWQQHLRQEAETLERDARIESAQHTSFDLVIRKLKGATSMIRIKVWCEGPTDRPIFRQLFTELGETEIADTIAFVGGWPNLRSEHEPQRWLDGCRQAVIIMDGDQGRHLSRTKRPLTAATTELVQRFRSYPLKLHVLQRHGIENYLPQHAYETVLQRDLNTYFPIPHDKKSDDHFCEPPAAPFYQKHRNGEIATHLTMADISDTDLAAIINEIHAAAEASRQYE